MNVQIEEFGESRRHAFDRLREAIDEEVDTVLGLDDILINDQLLALVLANFGLETLDSQQVAAGSFQPGLGDLEAMLLKLDNSIQILKPSVERHELVIILGNLCDQMGHEVVPPVNGGEIALRRRVPGIPQLPVDVQLPGEVEAPRKFPSGLGKNLPGTNGSSRRPAPGGVKRLYLFSPAPAPSVTKGRYAPDRARISLLAIWMSSFRTFSSRLPTQCLVDQARKHRIIVKLFYPELSGVFRAGRSLKLSGRPGAGSG